jgi:hypothetical protein
MREREREDLVRIVGEERSHERSINQLEGGSPAALPVPPLSPCFFSLLFRKEKD